MSTDPTTRKRQNRLSQQGEALTESAKRQVGEVGNIASDAVSSGAWAYPILVSQASGQGTRADKKGVIYLVARES